jgi:translation initiation factor IF-3
VESEKYRINDDIRSAEVRVIDENGEQLGVLATREAVRMAGERDLDLVEVAPLASPPVCKMMDFGKFKYQQSKRLQQSHKKQRGGQLKEVKLRPKISEHDFTFKLKKAEEFLSSGHKVKVILMFRGREIAHPEFGQRIIGKFIESSSVLGQVDSAPRSEGKVIVAVLSPRAGAVKPKEV